MKDEMRWWKDEMKDQGGIQGINEWPTMKVRKIMEDDGVKVVWKYGKNIEIIKWIWIWK